MPRVEKRTAQMFKDGLLEEVKALIAEGYGDWPALQSVGYNECLKFLRGEIKETQLAPLVIEKTMQLSKKQRTWFKRDPEIRWLNVENPFAEAKQLTQNFLAAT